MDGPKLYRVGEIVIIDGFRFKIGSQSEVALVLHPFGKASEEEIYKYKFKDVKIDQRRVGAAANWLGTSVLKTGGKND